LSAGGNALQSFLPLAWPAHSMSLTDGEITKRYVRDHLLDPEGLPSPLREWVQQSQEKQNWPIPAVTVAVCTRDRLEALEECLGHVSQLDYPQFDILVVDNGTDPVPARELAARYGANYARCLVPGLSRARNVALEHAKTPWIAFIDDDCRPEANWLKELVRLTQDENCRCVCGLVLPAQLENTAETMFEIYGGLGRGFAAKSYDRAFLRKDWFGPAQTWRIGAGANMLLHRQFALDAGGFDVDLGPGRHSVGGCGEETDIFYRVLRCGFNAHYTPRALVHHHHRSSANALRAQIHSYAVGQAAYHTRCFFRYRDYRALLHLAFQLPCKLAANIRAGVNARSKYPVSLTLLQINGTAAGPFKYAAAKARRLWRAIFPKEQAFANFVMPQFIPAPPVRPPRKLVTNNALASGSKSHRAA
jgi:glycosyltransferase involved in cell wall biosynthesis